jgi:AcrR family transcriptional regulator
LSATARRDQLLDVATQLVDELGFHRVSIEAIARAAGVTRATVYQHFDDLPDVLEAVIERETSRALAQVSETALPDLSRGDPVELMLTSLHAYLLAVQSRPRTWRLILIPPEGAPESLHASIAAGRRTVLAQLTEAVQPVLSLDRAQDAELTARLLSAISDEYARAVLSDPDRFPPDRLVEHARSWLSFAARSPDVDPERSRR